MIFKLAFVAQVCSMGQASMNDPSEKVIDPMLNVSSYAGTSNTTSTSFLPATVDGMLTNATATINATVGNSQGCTELAMTPDANSLITKVTFKWAFRGMWNGKPVDHTGLEFETQYATYAVAYNSATMPGPYDSPGMVFCQVGGMPMWDMRANGNCPGCGGWSSGGSQSGLNSMTLAVFMSKVKSWGDSHSTYNFDACKLPGGIHKANCQKTANHLYKELTGHFPSKGGCSYCPNECNEYEGVDSDEVLFV